MVSFDLFLAALHVTIIGIKSISYLLICNIFPLSFEWEVGGLIFVEWSFFGISLCVYHCFLVVALSGGFKFNEHSHISEIYDRSVLFTGKYNRIQEWWQKCPLIDRTVFLLTEVTFFLARKHKCPFSRFLWVVVSFSLFITSHYEVGKLWLSSPL